MLTRLPSTLSLLASVVCCIGCSSSHVESSRYLNNEEATREHMKTVEDEERARHASLKVQANANQKGL